MQLSVNAVLYSLLMVGAAGEYIVKTIREYEFHVLMDMLDPYLDHVLCSRGTSLIHYYGCHATQ